MVGLKASQRHHVYASCHGVHNNRTTGFTFFTFGELFISKPAELRQTPTLFK
jgi:hypothetical protein